MIIPTLCPVLITNLENHQNFQQTKKF